MVETTKAVTGTEINLSSYSWSSFICFVFSGDDDRPGS